MSKKDTSTFKIPTWLWVVALIMGTIFVNGQHTDNGKTTPAATNTAEQPTRDWMINLVLNHPDPVISVEMAGEWKKSKILIAPGNFGGRSNVLGSMSFVPRDDLLKEYGLETIYPVQAVMLLNPNVLTRARRDDLMKRKLMKTLRHEYEHYRQWKAGEHFQGDPESTTCEEIWEREFPVYLADCHRTNTWWPNQPSVYPDNRCEFANDEQAFARIIAGMIANQDPTCTATLKALASSI